MNEHIASLDQTLAAAKAAWAAQEKALTDRIFALETELHLTKESENRAVEARAASERMTMKLLTQFAVVSQIFDEARSVAISAGWNTEPEAKHNEGALGAVDAAVAALGGEHALSPS